jgi:FkbM family methyltransferase
MFEAIRDLASGERRGSRRPHVHALRFYRQFVPRRGLCFDIGANVGQRTALFLELGAKVVAVEPQPDCAEILRRKHPRASTVEAAIGPNAGTATLLVANYPTLATLSPDWIGAVKASGRFAEFEWNRELQVPLLTLDDLIRDYGIPDFCKIDVEGYEYGVLQGLSTPVPALALEFEKECAAERLLAVDHVASLGMREFNFSFGESLRFVFSAWVDRDTICGFLQEPVHTNVSFGDIYARTTRARRSIIHLRRHFK